MAQSLWLYRNLSSRWRLGYRAMILVVVVAGLHIPLLALVGLFTYRNTLALNATIATLLVVLVATLAGAAGVVWMLNQLLRPVQMTSESLREYTLNRTLPYNVSTSGPKGVDMVETLLLPHPDEGTGRPGEPPERPGPPDSLLGGEGQRLRLARRGNTTVVGVDALGAGGVVIVKTAVKAHNGVVVGIDRMLEPPKSLRA